MAMIKESQFSDFPLVGALKIEVNRVALDVIDSIFTRCNNEISGGAIRVSSLDGSCRFYRNCGTFCYTTVSDNARDYGQFIFVNCSKGSIVYEYLSASLCSDKKLVEMQNGALGFTGEACLKCLNSNSSNNFCRFGPGFATRSSHNMTLTYMNFANDTSHITTSDHWIAVTFHYESDGIVNYSNFVSCISSSENLTKPVGTFTNCIFSGCIKYGVGSPMNFIFPLKCEAKIKERSRAYYCKIRKIITSIATLYLLIAQIC